MKLWRSKNPEWVVKYYGKWNAEHTDENREKYRRWAKKNPAAVVYNYTKNHARRRNAKGGHTLAEWRSVLLLFSYRCVYCRVVLTDETASPDHNIPIARGGTNRIENIVPSCWPCNRSKRSLTGAEFRKRIGKAT